MIYKLTALSRILGCTKSSLVKYIQAGYLKPIQSGSHTQYSVTKSAFQRLVAIYKGGDK